MTDRSPPKNINAEKTVLGGCLIDASCIDEVRNVLPGPECFYATSHQVIWSAIVALYESLKPVETISVCEYLDRMGNLDACGGAGYIAGFEQHVLTTQNIGDHYADLVAKSYQRRNIIQFAHELAEDCHKEEIEQEDLLSASDQEFRRVTQTTERSGYEPMSTTASQGFADLVERSTGGGGGSAISTGFSEIDRYLTGLYSGELIVLAGRTSVGKSVTALNIACNVAYDKKLVLFFSLEDTGKQVYNRMLARYSDTPLNHIREGIKSPSILTALEPHDEMISGLPLYINDRSSNTIMNIRGECRKFRNLIGPPALIVVDYLQLITPPPCRGDVNRTAEVSVFSRNLKILAGDFDCPVLALAQLNRNSEHRTDRRPQLSDLRESGAIEQDADVVLFVHRETDDRNHTTPTTDMQEMQVIIGKQRNGSTGTVTLGWFPHFQKLVNLAAPSYQAAAPPVSPPSYSQAGSPPPIASAAERAAAKQAATDAATLPYAEKDMFANNDPNDKENREPFKSYPETT